VGPETGDDAGVYRFGDTALVATADFITPVCDDPRRFGRVAAANSLSDVWAMGGEPLFALNLCCFPTDGIPEGVLEGVLAGAGEALAEAGAALLGGHSVADPELKYGLAVIGRVDPEAMLTNDGARAGDRILLTKPLGTGVLVNAFKADQIDEAALEPALAEMERLNGEAARLAGEHGVRAATDVTGFGLVGHAWNVARGSQVALRFDYGSLPVHDGFFDLVRRGVTTGCTDLNRDHVAPHLVETRRLDETERALLFDPQTSGGLLLFVAAERADDLLAALRAGGHRAAAVGEAVAGPPRIEIA
jgi:selenide, water dikinase